MHMYFLNVLSFFAIRIPRRNGEGGCAQNEGLFSEEKRPYQGYQPQHGGW